MNKIKAVIWVLATPLVMALGFVIALCEHDWALKQYLSNARVYWYGGSYCDYDGRIFDKNHQQLYPNMTDTPRTEQ